MSTIQDQYGIVFDSRGMTKEEFEQNERDRAFMKKLEKDDPDHFWSLTGAEPEKVCYKCKERKPISEFHKDRSRKSNYSEACKLCKKKYYIAHRELMLERSRKWRRENDGRSKQYHKQRYQDLKRDRASTYIRERINSRREESDASPNKEN